MIESMNYVKDISVYISRMYNLRDKSFHYLDINDGSDDRKGIR